MVALERSADSRSVGERPADATRHGKQRRHQAGTMLYAKRIAHRLLLVLVLLNGLVGVLLWRGVATGSRRALVGSIPYPPKSQAGRDHLAGHQGDPFLTELSGDV